MTEKYYFECVNCKTKYKKDEVTYLCPECAKENSKNKRLKGILKVVYNYDKIKENFKRREDIIKIWPINSLASLSPLKVGNTPVYEINNLYFKFDALNPTFSFKDRASDLVVAYAKENNIDTIITASTGNAASSLAGICASQGIKSILFVPKTAPKAKLLQSGLYGGKIIPIDGTYDDAFELSIEASRKFGWYNRNTGYNPFTVEGKKSVAIELYFQFKEVGKEIPHNIFVATGDGVIISGLYKGLEDLLKMELINEMPNVIMVQSEGSRNLVQNIGKDEFTLTPSTTIADSISVDIPRNFYMAEEFILKYQGDTILVNDREILDASLELGKNYGLFAEPAAVTAYAGMKKWKNIGVNDREILILLTGSGLKDIFSIEKEINMPKPIKNLDELV